jgi:hypothetical protein
MLHENEVEEQTLGCSGTLSILHSVQSFELCGRAATEFFSEYTMRCICKRAVLWNERELSNAMQWNAARHSVRAVALIQNRALSEQITDPSHARIDLRG